MRLCLIRGLLLIIVAGLAACNLNAEASTTPTPTLNLLRVQFLSPTEGDRVLENYDLNLDLVAQDDLPAGGITRLEVYLNGDLLRETRPDEGQTVPVFRVNVNWFTQGVGTHVLSAIAYRADGTQSDEVFINLEVVPRENTNPGANESQTTE